MRASGRSLIHDVHFQAHQLPLLRDGFSFLPELEVRIAAVSGLSAPAASEAPGGPRPGRLAVMVDTGCRMSIFRWADLAARGVQRPATPQLSRFRSATGVEFEGFSVPVELRVADLPLAQMSVHATDQPLDYNFLGVDFVARQFTGFDLSLGFLYLAAVGVPARLSPPTPGRP